MKSQSVLSFLSKGGNMGELTCATDWGKTVLGSPDEWPQSLKTSLNILFNAKTPMFVCWGKELISFYNDEFTNILGDAIKHGPGKKLHQVIPKEWNNFAFHIHKVFETGNAYEEKQPLRAGKILNWTFNYSALLDEYRQIAGVLITCHKTGYDIGNEHREDDHKLVNIIKQAPLGITLLKGPDFMVEMANNNYLELVDKSGHELVGQPLLKALPEVKEAVGSILTQVYETGEPYYGNEFPVDLNRYGTIEKAYFNFIYHPLKGSDEKINGIMVVASDITGAIKAKSVLSERERQFGNLIMQSPIGMAIFTGEDFVIEMANKIILKRIWRKKRKEVQGKKLLDVFPELKDQKYLKLLKKVYNTGKIYKENEALMYINGEDGVRKFYIDFQYAPLYDPNSDQVSGVIVTIGDVTEKVEARKKVEEAETRLRLATEVTELSTFELDLKTRDIIYSPKLAAIFGHEVTEPFTHYQMRSQLHPDDRKKIVDKAFDKAIKTGYYEYSARIIKPDGETRWIKTEGKVFYDEDKNPAKLIGTLYDMTEEKRKQQEIIESEQKFRLLADSMPQLIWTADVEGNLNYYNKSVFEYFGLSPQQLMKGWCLQLVHPEDRAINLEAWNKSVATGQEFIFEHRFLRHDGKYRWQLSRARPQKDVHGNIQMWVGTSTDIEEQKQFTRELEEKVKERTKMLKEANEKLEHSIHELQSKNEELKSFAYVSSHDLQEPLRKIQTFSSRILDKERGKLSEKGKDYFARMQTAAQRMQTLIEDLLAYSRTNTVQGDFEIVSLNSMWEEVYVDLKEKIEETGAVIEIKDLCEARVIAFQFRQLLTNLVSNAIKFAKQGEKPQIIISSKIVKGSDIGTSGLSDHREYCRLSVSDRGIGFNAEYKERIFEVFQRLHGRNEYKGTGIGLAIVKKIVENHDGYIEATGEVGKGAAFHVYLPNS